MAGKELNKYPLRKEDTMLFYVPYSSFEDALPWLDENIMVVSDGCGGAGSMPHLCYQKDFGNYESLKRIILPEDKDDALKDYIMDEKVFLPLIQNEKEKYRLTSAFLGSRTALTRFLYAYNVLKERDMDKIHDFMLDGFRNLLKSAPLEKEIDASKSIFATTFELIVVNGETDDEVDVDVYWCGDSRAYYLAKDGLKQLSIDDEKEGGGLTCCLNIGKKIPSTISHRHYRLKKPCALFACSDGIFDIYDDNLMVEYSLSWFLVNSNSFEEFQKDLIAYYDAKKGDDTTIAWRFFDYDTSNYQKIKDDFTSLTKEDEELVIKKEKYLYVYLLKKNTEKLDNALRIMVDRVETRVADRIFKSIVDAYHSSINDPFVEQIVKGKIIPSIYQSMNTSKCNEELYYHVILYVKKSVDSIDDNDDASKLVDIENIFTEKEMKDNLKDVYHQVLLLKDLYNIHLDKINVVYQMYDKLTDYLLSLLMAVGVESKVYLKMMQSLQAGKFINANMENLDKEVARTMKLVDGGETLIEQYDSLTTKEKEINALLKVQIIKNSVSSTLKATFNKFLSLLPNGDFVPFININSSDNHVKKVIKELELDAPKDENIDIYQLLMDYYPNNHGYLELVLDRVSLMDQPCSFDEYLTPEQLAIAIRFEKAKHLPKNEVNPFIKQYESKDELIHSLLK